MDGVRGGETAEKDNAKQGRTDKRKGKQTGKREEKRC